MSITAMICGTIIILAFIFAATVILLDIVNTSGILDNMRTRGQLKNEYIQQRIDLEFSIIRESEKELKRRIVEELYPKLEKRIEEKYIDMILK